METTQFKPCWDMVARSKKIRTEQENKQREAEQEVEWQKAHGRKVGERSEDPGGNTDPTHGRAGDTDTARGQAGHQGTEQPTGEAAAGETAAEETAAGETTAEESTAGEREEKP